MMNGFVTPERTTLIASTHRIYTVDEKIALGDGRYDSERILTTANALAKRAILADFHKIAANTGAMINAALFGALAGSGTLPLPRAACEQAIRSAGKGAEASLRGFALGYAAAEGKAPAAASEPGDAGAAANAGTLAERVRRTFPAETHEIIEQGVARVTGFQDAAYAALYLDRLEPVVELEKRQGNAGGWQLTSETARFLALWMSYEDVIRVADLKSRRSRFERVRSEVQAKPGEPVRIVEYLKPAWRKSRRCCPPVFPNAWSPGRTSAASRTS